MVRILLAEDEQAMREYLTRALEKSGYEVVAVDRGTEAAPLLRAGQAMPQAKVLSKPFHLKDLVLEVERLFNKESASGQI
jgi:two-component system, cell cycle response regulator CpdR